MTGSPFATGGNPLGISVDASGKFVYVTDISTNPGAVKAFTLNSSTGALTGVTGSPFATGNSPYGVTTSVMWSTSDGTVAIISNTGGTQGLATGVSPGAVTVTATSGSVSGTASLTVQ